MESSTQKTNREIFMEKLINLNMDNFIKLLNSDGRCWECSNSYWDGNQNLCHKNINDSSCEKGQKEFFESYPNENLQIKYDKKYLCCENNKKALELKELIDLLYTSNTVCIECIRECEDCYEEGNKKCYRLTEDSTLFKNIMGQYKRFIKTECNKLLYDFDKTRFKEKHPFEIWLKENIIPFIIDKKIKDKVEKLYESIYA